ncbi:MAG: sodium:solute symporter family protein [Leptospiraceae bacterium]|nr:sodium:solute symporter family protein [Leptospiraceae bacterium]
MNWIDYIVIVIFLLITYIIAVRGKSKEESLDSYFQAKGSFGWFLSGTAMVATTFAADTPLSVTELVAANGISGNWLWWCLVVSSLSTVYFFSHLWKASGVHTDIELVKLRYDDSDFLRGFKTIYIGVLLNVIILSWVNLAMQKIVQVLFPEISSELVVTSLMLFAFVYTSISGLEGISKADAFQFFLAIGSCILLAIFSVQYIGGMEVLKQKIKPSHLTILPSMEAGSIPLKSFLGLIFIASWSSWYPGSEPGGGGYIAQRILAAKDKRNAVFSTLWFTLAHYFLRPWPWILVALVSGILFPNLSPADSGKGFVLMMKEVLPVGFLGLLVSAFLAAYLSTIATHLNWGASYFIQDLYEPFLSRNKSENEYLRVSKLFQLIISILSLIVTFYLIDTVSGVWTFLIQASAGVGFVLIARWYHPRFNSYSEIAGFIFPLILFKIGKFLFEFDYLGLLLFTSIGTIICVIIILLFTPKVSKETLEKFYLKVCPPGIFWKNWAIANNVPLQTSYISLATSTYLFIGGIFLVLGSLFSVGHLILGNYSYLFLSLPSVIIGVFITIRFFPK